MKPENMFKKWFVKTALPDFWWHEFLEPGLGTHIGIADSILAFRTGHGRLDYLWAEFKVLLEQKNGLLCLTGEGMRPAQIAWHTHWRERGAETVILGGLKSGGAWRPFVLPDNVLAIPSPAKKWDHTELKPWNQYLNERGL